MTQFCESVMSLLAHSLTVVFTAIVETEIPSAHSDRLWASDAEKSEK